MRWPSITTPEPVTSAGDCLVQGLSRSGRRNVAKILTTALSASWAMPGVGSGVGVVATTDPAFLVASLVVGGCAARASVPSNKAGRDRQRQETRVRVITSGATKNAADRR